MARKKMDLLSKLLTVDTFFSLLEQQNLINYLFLNPLD